VTDTFPSRNTHPSNSAGVPGISLPIAVNAEGLPLGLEIDAAVGCDRDVLVLARRVEGIIGRVPGSDTYGSYCDAVVSCPTRSRSCEGQC
jgi:mandelamide amidase